MIARKKVAPPITPRIVQSHPGQRLFMYVLLVCTVLLAAWIGYEYGRRQAPPGDAVPLVQSSSAEQDTTGLEQQRDALQQQVAKLEQRVVQLNRTLKAAQIPVQTSQQSQPAAREVRVQEPVATVAEVADNSLKLENVDIARMRDDSTFSLNFSLMHAGNSADRVIGTIWIAVNGSVNGKPTRLALKKLSPAGHSFVKMGFELQQDITEELVLPEDFYPRNILIEAKPFGEKYIGTSGTFDWNP